MSHEIDAIYDNGVLKPLVPLALPEKARVKLIVESRAIDESEREVSDSGIVNADFDTELDQLLFDGPSLPPNFSRADIYSDHD